MSTFLNAYVESARKLYLARYNKPMPESVEANLQQIIKERLSRPDVNEEIVIHNNYKHTVTEKRVLDVLDDMYEDKYIMTGYGTLFEKHDNNESPLIKFLIAMQNNRKKEKAMMFEHVNDADKREYMIHRIRQLLFKLISNAEYGASGEENYVFANPFIGPSTTYCGYAVITSGIMYLEGLMENNLTFETKDAFYRFIEECQIYVERFPETISEWLDDPNKITGEILYSYIKNKKLSYELDKDDPDILATCMNMDQEFRNRVYYTNNLYEFLSQQKIQEILSNCYSYNFTNPNEPPEEIAEPLKKLVGLVRSFVAHPFIRYNRAQIVKNMKRMNILLVDSDSLFTYLGRFVDYFENNFDGLDLDHPMHKIASAHIINNIVANVIQDILNAVTGGFNVSKQYQPRINMKSEFLFKRVAMTKNKKNYSTIIMVQEGNILDPLQDEIKGLPIKKVSTNIKTRKYFYDVLMNEILLKKDINPKTVLRKFVEYEEIVYNSLVHERSTEYIKPGKYSNISVYKDPTSNAIVKAVRFWNNAHPENLIQPYSKLNTLDLKPICRPEDAYCIKDKFPEFYEAIVRTLSDTEYYKSGINSIALPKKLKVIPEELIPLIDINKIVTDNTKAAYPIMESIGFQMIPTGVSTKQFSTFVNL